MPALARLNIRKIRLQKEEVRARDGGIMDFLEFLESSDSRDAEILNFKRFVVTGGLEVEGAEWEFTIIINLRGNTACFTLGSDCPWRSYAIFWAFEKEMQRWNHLREAPDQRALLAVSTGMPTPVYASTRDGFWLAAILHEIRDAGGFEVSLSDNLRAP